MDKKHKILVIDDEPGYREIVKEYAQIDNFEVLEAVDGNDGVNKFKNNKDIELIVLDIMMPKLDGWSVCKEIRKMSNIPIIMLSARGEDYDKLLGFELGVDDYVTKPFNPRELIARIKVFIRRNSIEKPNKSSSIMKVKGIELNIDSRSLLVDGKDITLTPKEFDLLSFFMKNENIAFSRSQLLDKVWGYDFFGEERTVDTHVKMLRNNLGEYKKLIKTVWGMGYKFQSDGES